MRSLTPPEPPYNISWRGMMDVAFEEACKAAKMGETPIGAALFSSEGNLIAKAHNQPIALNDPTGHAEILCLRKAGEKLGNYRLTNTILAVTLEPCIMCTGAVIHARIGGVIMGALDPKAGALVTNIEGHSLPFSNHKLWTLHGISENECSALLKRFFLEKRKN